MCLQKNIFSKYFQKIFTKFSKKFPKNFTEFYQKCSVNQIEAQVAQLTQNQASSGDQVTEFQAEIDRKTQLLTTLEGIFYKLKFFWIFPNSLKMSGIWNSFYVFSKNYFQAENASMRNQLNEVDQESMKLVREQNEVRI